MGPLVTVASFDSVLDADYWMMQLEAEGLHVVAADRETVTMAWYLAGALGGLKLQVPAEEVEQARAILAEREPSPRRPDPEPEAGSDSESAPRPASRDPGAKPRHAVMAALLGLPLPPLQLYGLWLILRVLPDRDKLDPRERRQLTVAIVLIAIGMASWLLIWMALATRWFR